MLSFKRIYIFEYILNEKIFRVKIREKFNLFMIIMIIFSLKNKDSTSLVRKWKWKSEMSYRQLSDISYSLRKGPYDISYTFRKESVRKLRQLFLGS